MIVPSLLPFLAVLAAALPAPETLAATPGFSLDVGIVLALVVQTGTLFYWGGRMSARLDGVEGRIREIMDQGSPLARQAATVLEHESESVLELRRRLEEIDHALVELAGRVDTVQRTCELRHGE